jgi:hypothetical protein
VEGRVGGFLNPRSGSTSRGFLIFSSEVWVSGAGFFMRLPLHGEPRIRGLLQRRLRSFCDPKPDRLKDGCFTMVHA